MSEFIVQDKSMDMKMIDEFNCQRFTGQSTAHDSTFNWLAIIGRLRLRLMFCPYNNN